MSRARLGIAAWPENYEGTTIRSGENPRSVGSHPCHEQSERDPQFWQGSNADVGGLRIPHATWSGFLRTGQTST